MESNQRHIRDAETEASIAQTENAPLLQGGTQQEPNRPPYDLSSLLEAHRRPHKANGMKLVAEISLLVWFATVLVVALTQKFELFTFHPILQSLSILLFYQGILVLQPTQGPSEKRTGLLLHEILQVLGFVSILAGGIVILLVKISHGANHFTSWHGLTGLITAILLIVQVLFGSLIGFEFIRDSKLLGESASRSLWKYHRASGYLIVIFLTLTVLTATKTDWLLGAAELTTVWILRITPLISIISLFSLINWRKIFG